MMLANAWQRVQYLLAAPHRPPDFFPSPREGAARAEAAVPTMPRRVSSAAFAGSFPSQSRTVPAMTTSDRVLATTHRLNWRSAWRAKSLNIPHRRLAEKTAVFAVELAGAFVSDLKSRTCRVQTIREHASPRCLPPKLFLILKRTHRR